MKFGSAYATRGSCSRVRIVQLVFAGLTETTVLSIWAKRFVGRASTAPRTPARPFADTCDLKPTMIEPGTAAGIPATCGRFAALATAAATSAEARAAARRRRRTGRLRMVSGPSAPPARSESALSERRAEPPNRHPSRECLAESRHEHTRRAGCSLPGAPRRRAVRDPES